MLVLSKPVVTPMSVLCKMTHRATIHVCFWAMFFGSSFITLIADTVKIPDYNQSVRCEITLLASKQSEALDIELKISNKSQKDLK